MPPLHLVKSSLLFVLSHAKRYWLLLVLQLPTKKRKEGFSSYKPYNLEKTKAVAASHTIIYSSSLAEKCSAPSDWKFLKFWFCAAFYHQAATEGNKLISLAQWDEKSSYQSTCRSPNRPAGGAHTLQPHIHLGLYRTSGQFKATATTVLV